MLNNVVTEDQRYSSSYLQLSQTVTQAEIALYVKVIALNES